MKQRLKHWSVYDTLITLILVFIILITVYPLYYVVISSISDPGRLVSHQGPLFLPLGIDFSSYSMVFDNPMVGRGYLNTLLYVTVGTSINVAMTVLGAFVISRKGLFWGKTIRFMVVFTMFFSGGMIPFFLTVQNLGLMDNWLAVILPYAINPMNLIIMRTSFQSVPVSLEESAKLDGASEPVILTKIIIPLSMPVIAVMIVFYGVGQWNSWFSAMMFLRDRAKYPLQLILREILITNSTDSMMTNIASSDKAPLSDTIKYATIVVATAPILFVYPFMQKHFVKGVMVGAIKE